MNTPPLLGGGEWEVPAMALAWGAHMRVFGFRSGRSGLGSTHVPH